MSGTGHWPRIDAEPEPWAADPTRWPRLRAGATVLAVIAAGGGAGWWWTSDPIGGLIGAVCLVVLVCAVVAVPWIAVRLDASDRRHAAADRDRERLALEAELLRTRQDTDHATLSVLGHRVEEQHLAITEVSSRQRNHELDELTARRARREQGC